MNFSICIKLFEWLNKQFEDEDIIRFANEFATDRNKLQIRELESNDEEVFQ